VGAINGNITIICNPEAAPVAEISWIKNGGNLALREGDATSGDRVRKLSNGNLFITNINLGDSARYTCVAHNANGEASSSGVLTVSCKSHFISLKYILEILRISVSTPGFLNCHNFVGLLFDGGHLGF
jgi:hypothetical protein